jgi:hypothetical protein
LAVIACLNMNQFQTGKSIDISLNRLSNSEYHLSRSEC